MERAREAAGTDPTSDSVREMAALEAARARESTQSERVGLGITRIAGTLQFTIVHLALFAGWITWNTLAPDAWRFDPFPFGVMTLIVSLEGVLLATFILIAQNRLGRQADLRNHLNLQISLLAEKEMTLVLRQLRAISARLGVQDASTAQADALLEDLKVEDVLTQIEREIPPDA